VFCVGPEIFFAAELHFADELNGIRKINIINEKQDYTRLYRVTQKSKNPALSV
jgi:hypothetical protein